MSQNGGGGCLKAFLIVGVLVAVACAVVLGTCVKIKRQVDAERAAAPPSTMSAAEQRLGKLGYCPGSGLKVLGGFSRIREAPPCPVEMYLARSLKDPSSYQGAPYAGTRACSVEESKDAWLVDCSFRAKNSFGALVVHTQRFHVMGGAVVKVENIRQ